METYNFPDRESLFPYYAFVKYGIYKHLIKTIPRNVN